MVVFGLQAEQLVQMICYPGGLPSVQVGDDDDDDEPKQRYQIARILRSVDQWSQRVSWLELQLMIKQASSSVIISNIIFQRRYAVFYGVKPEVRVHSGPLSESWLVPGDHQLIGEGANLTFKSADLVL